MPSEMTVLAELSIRVFQHGDRTYALVSGRGPDGKIAGHKIQIGQIDWDYEELMKKNDEEERR